MGSGRAVSVLPAVPEIERGEQSQHISRQMEGGARVDTTTIDGHNGNEESTRYAHGIQYTSKPLDCEQLLSSSIGIF